MLTATLEAAYHRLLLRIGCTVPSQPASPPCDVGYNLVLSPRWMLVVPRSQHEFLGVGVNGLGFLGALLARGDDVLGGIRNAGPVAVLRGVGLPVQLRTK